MFGLGLPEIVVILVVVVFLFSGSSGEKISEIAKSLGRFTGEFQKGKAELEKEVEKTRSEVKSNKNKG